MLLTKLGKVHNKTKRSEGKCSILLSNKPTQNVSPDLLVSAMWKVSPVFVFQKYLTPKMQYDLERYIKSMDQ